MGTEVLRPQDCLAERFHLSPSSFHHRRKYSPATLNGRGFTGNNHLHRNTTNYGHRNPIMVRPVQRKKPQYQEMTNPKRLASFDDFKVVSKHTKNNLNHNNDNLSKENLSHVEHANVRILRRGASLDSINVKIKKDHNNNNINNKTNLVPFGMHRFGISDTMYAGSAFSVSPSPSDLPLPTFFKKHQSFDDSASRDLRRLLRLE
ncbi:hypothetical protein LIER_15218 [Lithospermum erythrorhizon]|uniref:Uncharacterized protein n=1 Tax=Lithospermum erythrorhizon TaxID=34254 RepID=A0AAV3Q3I6_LITER